MKKILVCGAAGFLMSNFIRYVIHRTDYNEYKFAGIDKLRDPSDYDMLYVKPGRHTFYIGDVADEFFLKRVLYIEKPDVIINGIKEDDWLIQDTATNNLVDSSSARIIHLAWRGPTLPEVEQKVKGCGGVVLRLPRCFGMWDRNGFVFQIVKSMMLKNWVPCSNPTPASWVYAEDVASLIWYLIESDIHSCYVEMPPLGYSTMDSIAKLASKEIPYEIGNYLDVTENPSCQWRDWSPDSISFEDSLLKTVRWFTRNRWILSR